MATASVNNTAAAGRTEEEVAAKVMLNAKRQGVEDYFLKLFETTKKEIQSSKLGKLLARF
jgi:hypothetical protein